MKFTISDQPQAIDSLLRSCIGDFLKTLEDPDLNVRRVALVAFNSAAHNKPSLIRDLLPTVLPHLYNETQVGTLQFIFVLRRCTVLIVWSRMLPFSKPCSLRCCYSYADVEFS